jgi:hypothetical protein
VLPDGGVQQTDILVIITGFLQRRDAVAAIVLKTIEQFKIIFLQKRQLF